MNLYFFVFIITVIGLAGFFKVCKFKDVVIQCVPIIILAILIYSKVEIPRDVKFLLAIILIYPWYFMYLGYRELFRELKKLTTKK